MPLVAIGVDAGIIRAMNARPGLLVMLLLVSCARRGPEPHITAQTLETFLACEKKLDPDGDPIWSPTGRLGERGPAVDARARSEKFARECGYKSALELARWRVRMAVAFADVRDEEMAQRYPQGLSDEKRAHGLAVLQERVKRGESTEAEVEIRKRYYATVEARLRRIAERAKRPPKPTLDTSSLFDDETLKNYNVDRKLVSAEEKVQPPITEDEHIVVRLHVQPRPSPLQ